MRILLIAVAGAAGSLCRYGIGLAFGERSFPWSTLLINVGGSFTLGLVLTVADVRDWPPEVTTPIAIGFLGAFTTFSTFAWEGVSLARADRMAAAAGYAALSVALGFVAAAVGLRVGQAVQG
ncbi:MAG: camphor resistance protein CrcB [Acidimicrobiales bacterium]|nr:camphor resistance protein CrcB [Acidimicrobiales bacterium]